MENGHIHMSNGTAKSSNLSKQVLWTHPDPDSTRMAEFMWAVNRKHRLKLKTYDQLYRWSIDNIAEFWGEVWDFTGVTAEKVYEEVDDLPYLTCYATTSNSRS